MLSKSDNQEQDKDILPKLPDSVIHHYAKYRNPIPTVPQTYDGVLVEIDKKYEIKGKNSNGTMFKALDITAKSGRYESIALKVVDTASTRKTQIKQVLRELKISRLLHHEHVFSIKSILLPDSREKFNSLYICYRYQRTDLGSVIRSRFGLTNEHAQYFLYLILRGLKYVHSSGIIMQNLNSNAVYMNSDDNLLISDFSFARFIESGSCYGRYAKAAPDVTSYMAPELLLGIMKYDFAQDVWSVGLILAEMLRRRPLIIPTSTKTQIKNIFEMFETPSEDFFEKIPSKKMRDFVNSIPNKNSVPLESLMPPGTDDLAVDLLSKMLKIDWRERITIEDALGHPYLKELHDPYDEPIRDYLPKAEFEYEHYQKLSLEQLKDLVYEEILLYHFEDFKKEYHRKLVNGESPFIHILENDNSREQNLEESSDELE